MGRPTAAAARTGIDPGHRLIVSENEAAAMVGLAPRTLQGMRLAGGGPPFVQLTERRIGYAVSALETWVQQRTTASTSARAGR